MDTERTGILKMLADKTITVDEAERLLRALDEGERKREDQSRQESTGKRGFFAATEAIGEAVAGIGTAVKEVVEEVVTGLDAEFSEEEEGLSPVTLTGSAFRIEPGTVLVVKNKRSRDRHGRADLEIVGREGSDCQIGGDDVRNLRVLAAGSRAVILWDSGTLRVAVPSTVAHLKASTLGGRIHAGNVACPTKVKSMGGDLELVGVAAEFDAKTMGGHVSVAVTKQFAGRGVAETMGGNIALAAEALAGGRLRATTMGGTIEIDPAIGSVHSKGGMGSHRADVVIGDGSGTTDLKLKTMGGDIRVRRA